MKVHGFEDKSLGKVAPYGIYDVAADESGLLFHIHHYPPGMSKWNRIEYRLLCHITQNWHGRLSSDRRVMVELIGATKT